MTQVKTVYSTSFTRKGGMPRTRVVNPPPISAYGGRLAAYVSRLTPMQIAALADAANTPFDIPTGKGVGETVGQSSIRASDSMAVATKTSEAQEEAQSPVGSGGGWVGRGAGWGPGMWGGGQGRGPGAGGGKAGGFTGKVDAAVGGWWTPERQKEAMNYLMTEKGLPEVSARALVARWSAFEAPGGPGSRNPSSGAIGIAQWLGPRKAAGVPGSFRGQLEKVGHELDTSEVAAYRNLKSARTEQQAAAAAGSFERAGKDEARGRAVTQSAMQKIARGDTSKVSQDTESQKALADTAAARDGGRDIKSIDARGRSSFSPSERAMEVPMHQGGVRSGDYVTITSPSGRKLKVARAVAPNFQGFINEYERLGGVIGPSSGGVGNRYGNPSYHPTGYAIDVNQVGYGKRARTGKTLPPDVENRLARKYGLFPGSMFSGRSDIGHFEVRSMSAAAAAATGTPLPQGPFPDAGVAGGPSGSGVAGPGGFGGGPTEGRPLGYGPGGIGGLVGSMAQPISAQGGARGGVSATTSAPVERYIRSIDPKYRDMAIRQMGRMWNLTGQAMKKYAESPAFWTPGDIATDIGMAATGWRGGEIFGPGGLIGLIKASKGEVMPESLVKNYIRRQHGAYPGAQKK